MKVFPLLLILIWDTCFRDGWGLLSENHYKEINIRGVLGNKICVGNVFISVDN